MSGIWTDSHCHLAMAEDARAALDRARGEGVGGFVVPGTTLEDSRECVRLAAEEQDVWAAVGFHPHEAKDCDDAAFDEIELLAGSERVVAVGEVGLDYHYDLSPRSTQREVFARHMDLARRKSLPLIVHNRESTSDLLELLRSEPGRECRGILHSFTESYEVARELIDAGWVISFSGIVTFRTADDLRATARKLPPETVLIETDTPYLAPVPKRGKTNEPSFVRYIGELLADLWKIPREEVARVTTANFERVFGVEVG